MKNLSLFMFLLLLFTNCNREEKLSGDHCVCKVNGKRFVAGSKTLFSNALRAELNMAKNGFILECRNESSQVISIFLTDSIGFNIEQGTYLLKDTKVGISYYGYVAEYHDYNKDYKYSYLTDRDHQGVANIKFDTIGGRVSGTFAFKAKYNGGTGEEVNVTEGKFSLPYR